MKRERKCCYYLEPIRGRGKNAPMPWEVGIEAMDVKMRLRL